MISRTAQKIYTTAGMEAIFELIRKTPQDNKLLLASIGLAEANEDWIGLLNLLCESRTNFDITSKSYLEATTRCVENIDVSCWPIKDIERILVTCLPRWGSLIPKDSLPSLFGLVRALVKNGLCLHHNTAHSRASISQSADSLMHLKKDILRVLWFSSALTTLLGTLKTTIGDEDELISNMLFKHNKDRENERRSVVAAQEVALDCIGYLLEAALLPDMDRQLSEYLKQLSQDTLDSSSLPLAVSVSSFVAEIGGVKVRPDTVDAAARCLSGLLEVCDIAPSVFSSRVKTLGSQVIDSAVEAVKERKSAACIRLLDTMIAKLPSVALESRTLMNALQSEQTLFRSSVVLESILTVKDSESTEVTSGRAIALSRLNDKERSAKFLESSLGSPEWLVANIVLAKKDIQVLANYYSVIQSLRIRHEAVVQPSSGLVHEPSLLHLIHLSGASRPRLDIDSVNTVLEKNQSGMSLLKSLKLLMMTVSDKTELFERIKLASLATVAKLDIDSIRECPVMVATLLKILELALEFQINQSGLKVGKSENSSGGQIFSKFTSDVLMFARHKAHVPVLEVTFRCLPFFASEEGSNGLSQLMDQIMHAVAPGLALTSTPSVLSALEAVVQTLSQSMDPSMKTAVVNYITALATETASKTKIEKPVWIQFLTFVSSSLVVLYYEDLRGSNVGTLLWEVLACHTDVQQAAASPSWDSAKLKYSTNHYMWIQVLNLGVILLSSNMVSGSDRFFSVFGEHMTERFSTAHTSDLATLEEACLTSRLFELAGRTLSSPFQFTALITPKPPSMYPKSRAEKLAGNLPDLYDDDVRSPCTVPSVYAQRIVWIASDILASSLRRISRNQGATAGESNLFHALLDCSHFALQYLGELGGHRSRVIKTVHMGSDSTGLYVPLSVQLSVDGRDISTAPPPARRSVGGGSLLSSMSSPPVGASKSPAGPASLMDSLTPRNSPKNKESNAESKEPKFLPPLPGDCPFRTGLSFVAPALITEDDFVGKLVDVLTLCLLIAGRMAKTESRIRPLLDLLLTTKSNGAKLPVDGKDIINKIIEEITPRYSNLGTASALESKAMSPQMRPSIANGPVNPLGYAAISNIR